MTIDQVIAFLTKAKSKLGGDACLVLSLTDSGLQDVGIDDMKIMGRSDERYVEVRVKHPDVILGDFNYET